MDVRRTVDAVRRRWPIVVAVAVLLPALVGALTLSSAPRYRATTQGFVTVNSPETRSPNVLSSGSLFILGRMTSYAQLAVTGRVLDPVVSSLGLRRRA
jgi:polysaccharide biosynthesis transport protein